MKLTSRVIINSWIMGGVSLVNIERVLDLPFGSLKLLSLQEGPADPETETLLNMINVFPWLLDITDNNFKIPGVVCDSEQAAV